MRIEQIDQLLSAWARDLATIENNILELNGLLSYQILSEGPHRFTGRSATQVPAALQAVESLWESLHLIRAVLQKANSLRESLPIIKRAQVLAEIERLLSGPSVTLPTREVPLAQRSLLSSGERTAKTSLEQLKREMVQLFERGRATFGAIDKRWAELQPKLDEHRAKATELSMKVKECTRREVPEVDKLLSVLDDFDTQLRTDPLGFSDPEEFLRPFFKKAREVLSEARLEQSKRSARQEELAQHSERALRLEERAKASGQEVPQEVTRLRTALSDFSAKARNDLSFLDADLERLLRPFFRAAVKAVQALEARQGRVEEARKHLGAQRAKAAPLIEAARAAGGAALTAAERLRAALEELEESAGATPAEQLEEYLRAYFHQLQKAISRAEEERQESLSRRSALRPHVARAEALMKQAQALNASLPALERLKEELRSLEEQLTKDPSGFGDPSEYLEPFFRKASQELQGVTQPQKAASAPEEKLATLYEEARQIYQLAIRLRPKVVLPALPNQETMSAAYPQALATLRAIIASGGPVVASFEELRARLIKAKDSVAEHNLQDDKITKNYLTKLSVIFPDEGEIEASNLDSISLLVYSLELRISQLINPEGVLHASQPLKRAKDLSLKGRR